MIKNKEIETLEHSSVKLTITIGKDEVNKEYNDLLNKYAKTVHIKGFRKGKVPTKVLEQKFGDSLKGEATMNLMEKSLKESNENIDKKNSPYSTPVLVEEDEEKIIKLDADFTFSVKYDVEPEIEIEKYKGIEIESPICKIQKKDIDRELEKIQEQNSTVIEKTDGKVEKNDIVNIDYVELDEENNEVENAKREDFVFTVGTETNIYKFDDEIIGMSIDEEKVIEKEYPKDYQYSEFAGKKKKIRVKLNSVKVKDIPKLDDELAQDVSDEFETLKDLKDSVKKNLNETLKNVIENKNKQAILDKIIESIEFDLPESMIEYEIEQLWNQYLSRYNMSEEEIIKLLEIQGKTKKEICDEWRPVSVKNVKTYLVIEKLIKEEKIEASKEEIEEEIGREASAVNMTKENALEIYTKNGALPYIANKIKNDKLFDVLLKYAEVKEGEKKDFLDLIKE